MEFTEHFSAMYPHMVLVPQDDTYTMYHLVAPNQDDWFFELSQVSKYEWIVHGYKYDGDEMIKTYMLIDGKWIHVQEDA